MLGGEPNGLISSESLRPYWGSQLGTSAWLHPHGIWTSRRLRKGHGPLKQKHYQALSFIEMLRALLGPKELKRLETRTALAFIIGPLLFALGSWLQLQTSQPPFLALGMLAIGSVLFTAGGWWQLQQARIGDQALPKNGPLWEWCGLRCALTQSVGTVLFNIDTFFSWNQQQPNAELWLLLGILPNVIGSILFLISAAYGMQEVGHGRLLVFEPDHLGWWISIVNALGCVWFMQSAIAGWPTSVPLEQVLDSTMSMRTTLLGSLAFAIVGILSLAECSEDEIRPIEAPSSRQNL
jgi:hypothetical protein